MSRAEVDKREKTQTKSPDHYTIAYPVLHKILAPYLDNQYLKPFLTTHEDIRGGISVLHPKILKGTRISLITGYTIKSERYARVYFDQIQDRTLTDAQLSSIGEVAGNILIDPLTQQLIWIPPFRTAQREIYYPPGSDRPTDVTYKLYPSRETFPRDVKIEALAENLSSILGELWTPHVKYVISYWRKIGLK